MFASAVTVTISAIEASSVTVMISAVRAPSSVTTTAASIAASIGTVATGSNGVTTIGINPSVSAEVARELRHRCDLQLRDVPFFLQDFVDRHEGRYHDVQLPLPMRLA